jgi:hypothetical protein
MKKPIKPKPCGHCGKKPVVIRNDSHGYQVTCIKPNCVKPYTDIRSTEREAVDEWNEETV